jgi:hypothetical protein
VVFNSLLRASLHHLTKPHRAKRFVGSASVALTSGFAIFVSGLIPAHSFEEFAPVSNSIAQVTHGVDVVGVEAEPDHQAASSQRPSPTNSYALTDGVYLYGQSPERDQIGSAYMVFEVEQGQVVGAFYMPYSSFDCFYGDLQTDRIALTVIDSYEQTQHPYAIALEPVDTLATVEAESVPVGLEGFHRIEDPSDNDLAILSTCQSDVQ